MKEAIIVGARENIQVTAADLVLIVEHYLLILAACRWLLDTEQTDQSIEAIGQC